ncbi:MAG: helix-turn-helix domain-containing protein [Nitrospirae bacterium]|nr:helix-turn-helix domain-containing protein [Nitrospirota bacterium]MBI3393508.1 helix-turn-helix domain-containing protein [Nitrospirota bacterium]
MRDRLRRHPLLEKYVRKQSKDPEFAAHLERARLRVAIARAIKDARERAKLTQAELAEALGTTQSAIGRMESLRDKRLPSLDLLARIAAATHRRLVVDQPGVHFEVTVRRQRKPLLPIVQAEATP